MWFKKKLHTCFPASYHIFTLKELLYTNSGAAICLLIQPGKDRKGFLEETMLRWILRGNGHCLANKLGECVEKRCSKGKKGILVEGWAQCLWGAKRNALWFYISAERSMVCSRQVGNYLLRLCRQWSGHSLEINTGYCLLGNNQDNPPESWFGWSNDLKNCFARPAWLYFQSWVL